MWIYSQDGFVAIAKFNWSKKGASEFAQAAGMGSDELTAQPLWLVRARRQADLERFLDGGARNGVRILKLDNADYQYRALVTAPQLMRCVNMALAGIDYDTLKKAVSAKGDKDYLSALYGTWSETLWSLDERVEDSIGSGWQDRLFDEWEDEING